MSLTLANMLTRVKRNVPTTVMDTELQDALLERMNYLATIDAFPFQEGYQYTTLSLNDWRVSTPSNFAYPKALTIYHAGYEAPLERLDASIFNTLYPMPSNATAAKPIHYCVKVAEGEIWFNCPVDVAYVIRILFHKIPDDATDTTVTQLVELAKILLVQWGSADGFRMMGEYDRADRVEAVGGLFDPNTGNATGYLGTLMRRYAMAMEEDARFISQQEILANRKRGYNG